MHYQKLDTEQFKAMLDQRLTQYEQEHYNHSVNKDLLESTGDDSDQTKAAIKAADDAMATLDAAHTRCCEMLAELDGESH